MDRRTVLLAGLSGAAPVAPSACPEAPGRWRPTAGDGVRPEAFGAVGDGETDDTLALQAAISHCLEAGVNLLLRPARYLVCRSLNATSRSNHQNFWIIGQGKFLSQIVHAFPPTEAFPVVDMCGNTFGGLVGLGVVPHGRSHATCAWLAAKGEPGGSVGNGQAAYECLFDAGLTAGDCAVVICSTDLSRLVDCTISSGAQAGGVSIGLGRPQGVTSKYVAIPPALDWTQGYVVRCELAGSLAPALTFTGGAALMIRDTYCALTGVGSSKIVEVVSPVATSGNALFVDGLRTENQSAATGVAALYFTSASGDGDVVAVLSSDAAGAMIGSGPRGAISNYRLKVVGDTSALFALDAPIANCRIEASPGRQGVGTSSAAAASSGLDFMGAANAAQVLALFGGAAGLRVSHAGLESSSLNRGLFSPGARQRLGRGRMVLKQASLATRVYAGGGGPRSVLNDELPLEALSGWSHQLPPPHLTYEVAFRMGGLGVGGTLAVRLVQAGAGADLMVASPPAAGAAMKLTLNIHALGSADDLRADIVLLMGDRSQTALVDLRAAGIGASGGAASLALVVTSSADVPATEAIVVCQV